MLRRLPDERARQQLAQLHGAKPLPGELASGLHDALERLGGAPHLLLAVRSSAVADDTREASFAGQHATRLGVRPDAVEDAVRECWASLLSRRAVAYRAARGLPFAGAGMAVLVQPLVPAEASAIAFTRSPITQSRDEIVINATRGLGEPLVSGEVEADTPGDAGAAAPGHSDRVPPDRHPRAGRRSSASGAPGRTTWRGRSRAGRTSPTPCGARSRASAGSEGGAAPASTPTGEGRRSHNHSLMHDIRFVSFAMSARDGSPGEACPAKRGPPTPRGSHAPGA